MTNPTAANYPDPTDPATWGEEWREHPAWPPKFAIGERVDFLDHAGCRMAATYCGRIVTPRGDVVLRLEFGHFLAEPDRVVLRLGRPRKGSTKQCS